VREACVSAPINIQPRRLKEQRRRKAKVEDLFKVYSVAKEFLGYKDVALCWLRLGKPTPPRDYKSLIENHDGGWNVGLRQDPEAAM
jgi:hypothetical protein